MKIDRLIGIITLLLQNEKMTAPQLATRFEVSRRTIHRDIEVLCKAGIPLITTQGVDGGISIMDSYKMDKTLLTDTDLQAIITGLTSLDSVSEDLKYRNIIDKFLAHKEHSCTFNTIMIDLSSHYKSTLAPQIKLINESIQNHTHIIFQYFNKNGKQQIILHPYLIVFKWSNWYVFGYCLEHAQFRLYKLNRITDLQCTNTPFEWIEIPSESLNFDNYFTNEIHAIIYFESSQKYRLIEEYGINSFSEMPDGRLCFSFPFTNPDYLISWVLSFGAHAELIEPQALRPLLKEQLEKNLKHYL